MEQKISDGQFYKIVSILFLLIFVILILIAYLSNVFANHSQSHTKNHKQELRARNISKNIRCMVCQNQSIDESNAPLAKDLRILIREKIKNGKTNDEIYDFLTERYGDFILLKPAFKLNTFLLCPFLKLFYL